MHPDQITLKGAVHIVFHIGYKKSEANERAKNNCHAWQEKG